MAGDAQSEGYAVIYSYSFSPTSILDINKLVGLMLGCCLVRGLCSDLYHLYHMKACSAFLWRLKMSGVSVLAGLDLLELTGLTYP